MTEDGENEAKRPGSYSAGHVVLAAAGGALGGFAIAKWLEQRKKKSWAEEHHPDRVSAIGTALDQFFDSASIDYELLWSENQITDTVAYAMQVAWRQRWTVQVRHGVGPEGSIADIVIDGLFVVESKKTPVIKTEIDRCYGQCECLVATVPVIVLAVGPKDGAGIRRLERRLAKLRVGVVDFTGGD